jgi:hypothetical protein
MKHRDNFMQFADSLIIVLVISPWTVIEVSFTERIRHSPFDGDN